jgi:hypothetical protein
MFGPNEKNDGRFALLAKDWEKQIGTVTYNGESYTVRNTSAFSTLLVDLKKVVNNKSKYKSEKGRRVD